MSKLSHEQSALFLEIAEKSLYIKSRDQFFSWIQGSFQYLFPHEVMICGMSSAGDQQYRYEIFSSLPQFQRCSAYQLMQQEHGALARAFDYWQESRRPVIISSEIKIGDYGSYTVPFDDSHAAEDMQSYNNLVMHGVRALHGGVSSFFCFAQMPKQPDEEALYILDLLMPHLHLLLIRISASQYGTDGLNAPANQSVGLTARECMVLKWLKNAKTNWEIAAILNISPLTVKNHVQNIMRKLEADNRAQAVLKARLLNIID